MSKFEKGHLYGDGWYTQFLYLVLDDNGEALRFIPVIPSDFECYVYDGCIDLTSEDLQEINSRFRLFWLLSPQIASDVWRLCLIFGDQVPTTGMAFPDMDGVLGRLRTRQEESLCVYPPPIDDFDVLGSFFFYNGKVHYRLYPKDNMIFEKIMNVYREGTT